MTDSTKNQNPETRIVIELERDTVETLDKWRANYPKINRSEAIRFLLGLSLAHY